MGKWNLYKYSCKRAQRPARDFGWAVLFRTQKPRLVFAKSVHMVLYFPQSLFFSFFPPPLCMSNILILEEIVVGFCGQFGGGEMKDGIFVSAYKCRKFVWGQVARPLSGVTSLVCVTLSRALLRRDYLKSPCTGRHRALIIHTGLYVNCTLVQLHSFVSQCLLLHTTLDLLMSLSFWCLHEVALQREVPFLAHGWTGRLPGPDPIAVWFCASKITLKSTQLSLLIHFAASAWIVEESH